MQTDQKLARTEIRQPVALGARLAADDGGATTIVFAVLIVPLLALIMGVVDIGRAYTLKGTLQNAADAAIHTASLQLPLGAQRAEATFAVAFRENLPETLKDHAYELTVAEDASALSVKIEGTIDTTLLGVVGRNKLGVQVAAKAERAAPASTPVQPVEDVPAVRRAFDSTVRSARHGTGAPHRGIGGSTPASTSGVTVHGRLPNDAEKHLDVSPEDQRRIDDLQAELTRKMESLMARYR
ncbi:MAG: TadE/TadG family type IV pilus assembly protein [Hyphomicrobiaceae bacterium]|nr:TadE/TadG family type IV pilus assembly protein [Hyphomicrobiaceae bacterium]